MAASTGRVTHVGKVRDFLRRSPSIISRDYFFDGLRGTGPGFKTDHDIGNRITHAKQTGELISLGRGKGYRNTLAHPEAHPAASVKHINGSAAVESESHQSDGLETFSDLVKVADGIAQDAMKDTAITRIEILAALLMLTGAFKTLQPGSSS
jgi:hypothetical protein